MILLCDENVGTGVPNALKLVGYEAHALYDLGWGGTPDTQWLTRAGQNGWLVYSSNKKMLLVPSEKETIVREKVGIVFLTNGEERIAKVLQLLLSRWEFLDLLDKTEPRPFVRFLSPNGQNSSKYRHYRL